MSQFTWRSFFAGGLIGAVGAILFALVGAPNLAGVTVTAAGLNAFVAVILLGKEQLGKAK